MLELKIDNSVIPFSTPKLHLGQAVSLTDDATPGYIIGMQRDKYTWQYLVVAGTALANDADEEWYDESKLYARTIPVNPSPPHGLDTLRIAS
jgi:hypothetical protein